MGIPRPLRSYASALAAPPLPALLAASLVAWVGLAAVGHGESGSHGAHPGGRMAPLSAGAAWLGMLVAMMAPLLAAPIRHLWLRSFRRRRVRSVGAFVVGYVTVWMLAGAVLTVAAAALQAWAGPGGWRAPGVALAVVLVWQASPWKQRCLNRCHRTPPLAAFGWAADRDALRYGLRTGVRCVGSCWALMVLPLAFGAAGFAVMGVVALVMVAERWGPARPARWHLPVPRLSAR